MLTELTIKQLGVIEQATLQPGGGLTVVTGETGAGKTMVVQGLGLVSGTRADATVVRHRQGTAQIEARLTALPADLLEQVEAAGGQLDESELLVTRHVASTGRSRAWLGGTAVPLGVIHDLDLVTIHGQSEQIRLSTAERQRAVLDRAAGPELVPVLNRYRQAYAQRQAVATELAELTTSASEDEALVAEATALQDADQLRSYAGEAVVALAGDEFSDEDVSALTALNMARKSLRMAAQVDPRAESLAQLAETTAAQMTDLAGQTATYLADLAGDPMRLEWIETRLAEVKKLTRKYGANATP